ncbi:DUF4126 domain-containing protein [Luteolibacter sp. SL250]|uniref:DUF4126 domain-containing protein n=1 Tax=Luteolibacter sp. SL250 TaxID=2995170 RepID=UPI00226EB034|nr:DUF4126 domain-containing protein [Luteolibacter sp. SL250]WAC20872.1 DUF4126 domain-containing protein [Luteolibacter sp. SL250]
MSVIDQLGVALGLATLAGVNLYLTVLVAGLAIRFDWIGLSSSYEQLSVLGNDWVLGVAGVMFVIQFFADKVPWLDSLWDAVHTVIRPVGGVLIALAALGKMDPAVLTVGALLAGGASLATHGTKAGVRALLNLSPEPVSNSVASVTEDGLVLGGLGLIGLFPAVAFVVFLVIAVLCAAFAIWLWKKIFRRRKRRGEELATA